MSSLARASVVLIAVRATFPAASSLKKEKKSSDGTAFADAARKKKKNTFHT